METQFKDFIHFLIVEKGLQKIRLFHMRRD